MTSKRALFMLMINQKKVRDGFKLVDLNTLEKVSIEDCYEIVEKDLEILEIIKKHKLLNYVLKNEKCANMYHLSKEECDLLRELEK